MDLYNRAFEGHKMQKGHADRNKESIKAVHEAKTLLFKELGIEEMEAFELNYFPSLKEREALSVLINYATTPQEFSEAFKRAKIFRMIPQDSDHACSSDVSRLHATLDDFQKIFQMAIHPNSEEGTMISINEKEMLMNVLNKLVWDIQKVHSCFSKE